MSIVVRNSNSESMTIVQRDATIVTNSTVRPNISLNELREFCRQRRITGELRIVLNDGGVRQIFLTERKNVDNGSDGM